MKSVRELNQYVYLLLGLERLLGSRPKIYGGLLLIVVIVAGVGFYWYQTNDPHRKIPLADQLWNRQEFPEAVMEYQQILSARDPFLSGGHWMTTGRARLYRRIILFKSLYVDKTEAKDWLHRAQDEGITELQFPNVETQQLWHDEKL